MEISIRVRRSGGRRAPAEGGRIRANGPARWRYWHLAALAAVLSLTLLVGGKVRAARDRSGEAASPALEVTSLTLRQAGRLVTVEGVVTNRSNQTFEYVWVRASFEDERGSRVSSSDDALIESARLAPGQSAPFRLYGVWNPAITRCGLEFTHMARLRLPASGAAAALRAGAR